MATSAQAQGILRFGDFSLEPVTAELRRNGVPVRLAYQPARILVLLAGHAGQTVTREEIVREIWGADTFVGFDQGLNAAIRQIRTALGDDADHPSYIETIPKRGYRFIGELQPDKQNNGGMDVLAEAADRESVLSDASAAPRVRPRRDFKWFVWFPIAILGIFALWWSMPLPPPHVLGIEQVTTSGKLDTPIRLVVDANRVFYIERNGDHWNLLQKSLDGGAPSILPSPEDSAMPLDISRDGSMLLVGTFKRRDEQKRLWIIPTNGGSPRSLSTLAGDAVFSSTAKQIAFIEDDALWTLATDGSGSPRKLASLPAASWWLAWSPDGSRIRFTVSRGESEIWEIASDGTKLHRLPLDGLKSACYGTWTRDGRYFIFTALYGEHFETWALREHGTWWRRSPRGPFRLTSGPDSPFSGAPSGEGRRIVFYNGPWRQQYLRLDLSTRQFSPAARQNGPESFSRQGDWIAYNQAYGGALFRSRLDGSASIELAPANLNPTFPRWSPDGKSIVFIGGLADQPGGPYIVPAGGGEPQRVLPGRGQLTDADWSGDGRQLVMAHARSTKESDGFELWIVDRDGARIQPIPGSEHLAMSRWSYDGHYISATRDDQTEIRLWDVERREWHTIAHGTAFGISAWSADSRYLYFQDILAPGEPLYRYDSRSRRVELAAEFSEMLRTGASRCAFSGLTPDGSPMMIVNNSFYDLFAADVVLP